MAKWFGIFISQIRRIQQKWGFYTRNGALKQILKSDFDVKQQKRKKIVIFFYSLSFLIFKYFLFPGTSGHVWY